MREGRVAGEAKKGEKSKLYRSTDREKEWRESEKDFHVREHSSGHAWMQGTLNL